jgi:hypothetical protein
VNIRPAGAEQLQINDPLQTVRVPPGRILLQDKRGFWEDDSPDWLDALLRDFRLREGLRCPLRLVHPKRLNKAALNPPEWRVWRYAVHLLGLKGTSSSYSPVLANGLRPTLVCPA